METNERFFYLRDVNGHPIGVVAIVVFADRFYLGVSLCSKRDAWSRDIGRRIAVGRAKTCRWPWLRFDARAAAREQTNNARRLGDVDWQRGHAAYLRLFNHMCRPRKAAV